MSLLFWAGTWLCPALSTACAEPLTRINYALGLSNFELGLNDGEGRSL